MNNVLKYSPLLKVFYIIITLLLFLVSMENYIGKKIFYTIFTISISIFFLNSFNKKKIKLFDFFLSIFVWFGFYFKFYICTNIIKIFPEGIGNFDFTPNSFDEVMLVSSIGVCGFILGSYVIPKKININIKLSYLEKFYYTNSKIIIIFILFSIIVFSLINLKFGFFQKGFVSNLFLGEIFRNFIAFLFMLGFGSIISFVVYYSLQKKNFMIIYLPLIETFLTSFSMLSRAMIFNFFPFLIGYLLKISEHKFIKINRFKILLFTISLITLILLSILTTSSLRSQKNIYKTNNLNENYYQNIFEDNYNVFDKTILTNNNSQLYSSKKVNEDITDNENFFNLSKKFYDKFIQIVLYRFVGIEGVMAVQGQNDKNYDLYFLSFKEKYKENSASFYDRNFLKETSSYNKSLKKIENQHAITLPGFIAHSFYTGSYFFVFFSTLFISIFCNLIITIINCLFKNVIFSSFISNILAYRLIHWGFAPTNSYKLIIGIIIVIIIIILLNYGIKKLYFKR